MNNKLGQYISNLMTVILDSNQEQFVVDLALSELRRLNVDLEEFLRKHTKDDSEEAEKTEKQLLQEDKKNVKDK
jgi:hypothetical protein